MVCDTTQRKYGFVCDLFDPKCREEYLFLKEYFSQIMKHKKTKRLFEKTENMNDEFSE